MKKRWGLGLASLLLMGIASSFSNKSSAENQEKLSSFRALLEVFRKARANDANLLAENVMEFLGEPTKMYEIVDIEDHPEVEDVVEFPFGYETYGQMTYDIGEPVEKGRSGDHITFHVAKDWQVDLYGAIITLDKTASNPMTSQQYTEWVANFLNQDVSEFEKVITNQTLMQFTAGSRPGGKYELTFHYPLLTAIVDLESLETIRYDFNSPSFETRYEPKLSNDEVKALETREDLTEADILDLLGDKWRATYDVRNKTMTYTWAVFRRYGATATVDASHKVTSVEVSLRKRKN